MCMEIDLFDTEEFRATEALLDDMETESFPLLLNDEDLWFED